jgi:branched-chain amino acid transport system permease protein
MGIAIWSGLVDGAVFALVAAGFTVSLLPSGVLNFAQGGLTVAGGYLAYLWMTKLGIPEVVAILLNLITGAILGAACEQITVRPLRGRTGLSTGSASLITTVGMATVIAGLAGVIWGYNPLTVPFHGPSKLLHVFGVNEAPIEVIIVVLAIVVTLGLYAWSRWTLLGQACRATAQDRDAAKLRGINVDALSLGAWATAGALGALAGALVGPVTYAVPDLVDTLALSGFVAIAIGGEGSFLGALIGGMVAGLVSALATRYLGANYSDLSVLAALLLTLSLKPKGLGGLVEHRVV